jgi:hypothetical protein
VRADPGSEFTWPIAPGIDGSPIDLRMTPKDPHYTVHAARQTKKSWNLRFFSL